MTIPAAQAAELGLLTQALDLSGTDIADTLSRLATDAQTAVDSYLGLTVRSTGTDSEFDLTVLCDGTEPDDIRTSLLVPLSATYVGVSKSTTSVVLILYAATPGAFTDVAADLSRITGRALADFRLDKHRPLPASHTNPTATGMMSTINQALGVLIGHGSTPEQAERDLYTRAVAADIDLVGAATLVLAALTAPVPESGSGSGSGSESGSEDVRP